MYNQTPTLPHASTLIKFASKTNGTETSIFDGKKAHIVVKNLNLNGNILPVPFKILSAETQIREQAFSKILERVNPFTSTDENALIRPTAIYTAPP